MLEFDGDLDRHLLDQAIPDDDDEPDDDDAGDSDGVPTLADLLAGLQRRLVECYGEARG